MTNSFFTSIIDKNLDGNLARLLSELKCLKVVFSVGTGKDIVIPKLNLIFQIDKRKGKKGEYYHSSKEENVFHLVRIDICNYLDPLTFNTTDIDENGNIDYLNIIPYYDNWDIIDIITEFIPKDNDLKHVLYSITKDNEASRERKDKLEINLEGIISWFHYFPDNDYQIPKNICDIIIKKYNNNLGKFLEEVTRKDLESCIGMKWANIIYEFIMKNNSIESMK